MGYSSALFSSPIQRRKSIYLLSSSLTRSPHLLVLGGNQLAYCIVFCRVRGGWGNPLRPPPPLQRLFLPLYTAFYEEIVAAALSHCVVRYSRGLVFVTLLSDPKFGIRLRE